VLDDGATKLVFVVCDSLYIGREVYDLSKQQIEKELGIPADHQMMSATHTHSGTACKAKNVLNPPKELDEYEMFVARRIVDGVKRAVNNLAPAEIGWGFAEEPAEVHNRRWYMTPGSPQLVNPFGDVDKVKMNPSMPGMVKPAGPVDPQIGFISVRAPGTGRPIALLANYSLHYVGGVGAADISADYFAAFADRIQQLLGADRLDPPFVGIMSNGTSGNINNIDFEGRVAGKSSERKQPYERIREVADTVAQKVLAVYKQTPHRTDVTLGSRQTELTLKVRIPTKSQIEWAKAEMAKPEGENKHKLARAYAERMLVQADSPSTLPIILQTFRIGDLAVCSSPFETFVETGLDIKQRSPFKSTFTIELANGGYGYLPSAEHYPLGGYETWLTTNKVEAGSAEKIADRLIEMLKELKVKN
jgi:hypothetical protein